MTLVELQERRREDVEKELLQLYKDQKDAGIGIAGDIKIRITHLEELLQEIDQKIEKLQGAKFPNQWNIKIFVITNYIDNIKKHVPEDIFCKIPFDRNSNDKIENWIPYYDNKKTIKMLLEEFKEAEKFEFSVVYLNGHDNQCELEEIIDDSINDGCAIGIIDLLGINTVNRHLAKRFDTQIVKSSILPICRKLPLEVQDYMIESQKSLFSLSNRKFNNELCCFFTMTSGGDQLIQHLRRIYSTHWKIKNQISDLNEDNIDVRNLKPGFQ